MLRTIENDLDYLLENWDQYTEEERKEYLKNTKGLAKKLADRNKNYQTKFLKKTVEAHD